MTMASSAKCEETADKQNNKDSATTETETNEIKLSVEAKTTKVSAPTATLATGTTTAATTSSVSSTPSSPPATATTTTATAAPTASTDDDSSSKNDTSTRSSNADTNNVSFDVPPLLSPFYLYNLQGNEIPQRSLSQQVFDHDDLFFQFLTFYDILMEQQNEEEQAYHEDTDTNINQQQQDHDEQQGNFANELQDHEHALQETDESDIDKNKNKSAKLRVHYSHPKDVTSSLSQTQQKDDTDKHNEDESWNWQEHVVIQDPHSWLNQQQQTFLLNNNGLPIATPITIGWFPTTHKIRNKEKKQADPKTNKTVPFKRNTVTPQTTFQLMNRNARRPKRANRGKRPCSRHRRRVKRDSLGNPRCK